MISNIDHIHFGLWAANKLDISIEEAQEHMLEVLVSYLPEPSGKILVVDCESELSVPLLARKGYSQSDSVRLKYRSDRLDFRAVDSLQDDNLELGEGAYGAVLILESLKHLGPLDILLAKLRRLLTDKGTMIIGDRVCYETKVDSAADILLASQLYAALAEGGYRITAREMLGERVLPTYDSVINRLRTQLKSDSSSRSDGGRRNDLQIFISALEKERQWHAGGKLGYEILVAKKDSYFIRPYQSGDEYEINSMFREVFNSERSLEHWYWKYRDNPYGTYKIGMAISPERKIVSHYGGYPIPFCSTVEQAGKPVMFLTLHAGDTMTHPSVRRIGLGRSGLLARTTFYYYAKFLEGQLPFAYGFNTGKVRKLGERFLDYSYTDPVTMWIKNGSQKAFSPLGFFTRILSGLSVELIDNIDSEWDEFFDRVCLTYEFLVKRDAEYLQWRYLNCPDKHYKLLAFRKWKRLIGWSVFTVEGETLQWGDALFDKKYLKNLPAFFCILLEKYFADTDRIESWFSPNPTWWVEQLQAIGFRPIPEPNGLTCCYRLFRNNVLERGSVDRKVNRDFYYTWGDSDLF